MTIFSWLAALGSRKSSKVLRQASGEGRNLRDDDMSTMRTKSLGDGFFKNRLSDDKSDLSVLLLVSCQSFGWCIFFDLFVIQAPPTSTGSVLAGQVRRNSCFGELLFQFSWKKFS